MDVDVGNNDKEPFLKIGMIWSESEENFEKIPIKEEIKSDDEDKSKFSTLEEEKTDQEQENSTCKTPDPEEPPRSEFAKSYALLWQEKNSMKSKDQNDESEIGNSPKPWCTHNVKNFKLVKKRLRCSDCKALVCPECCKVFPILQNHLSTNYPLSSGFFTCKSCPLAFQSLCALQAHLRIHTLESPHVCPDCGLIYNNIYFLILHLINKCYHVYKIVRYKCKSCPDDYFSPSKFMHHIKEKHIIKMIRCSYCSLMFNDQDEFDVHLDTIHFKQKIHRLNYYCCLLCSDMLIPQAMYQKHVDQHCEAPEGYDIDYQCCCGEISRLATPFRAHITFCPKKGILPSYWGFLQKNLKSQGAISVESGQDDQDPLEENGENDLDFSTVLGLYNSTIKSNNSPSEKKQDDNMVSDEPGRSNPSLTVENSEDLIDFSQDDGEEISGDLTSTDKKSATVSVNSSPLNGSNSVRTTNDGTGVQEVELLTAGSKESEGQPSAQECDTTLAGERSGVNNSEKGHSQAKEKNGVHVDTEISRMGYDHIPCDHLGYLRIQGSDLKKKDNDVGEMASSSSNEFHTITELDERTGLIMTKKIPIETIYEDETDCKDESSEDSNAGNNSPREMFNGDKVKIKLSSNAYFMCPFCVVLFPKGISALQQFSLHIESYHSDAALNITVNQGESDKPDNHCLITRGRGRPSIFDNLKNTDDSSTNKEQPSSFESGSFKVVATKTYRRKTIEDDKRAEGNSNTSNREKRLENGNDDSVIQGGEIEEVAINDSDVDKVGKLPKEEGKENESGEFDKSFKELDEKKGSDLCWSMKLSVESNESLNHENRTLSAEERSTTDDSILGIVNKSDTKGDSLDSSDLAEKKENEGETPKTTPETDEKESKKVVVKDKPRILAPIQGRSCIVLLEKKDADQYTSTLISRNRDATNEQRVLGKSHNSKMSSFQDDKQNKKKLESLIEGVPSDYDKEYDNSKDSNWSAESSTGFLSESKTSECPEGTSMRTRSSEKTRRESEVWSEFYESLKLAEKLKKSKKRKASLENNKECVALPDYSSKRVVKKPKRYRQSSDSQDSMGDYEISESDDEIDFSEKSGPEIHSQGQDGTEKQNTDGRILKKQKLLNKIERFDPKIVDCLFELLKRRESYDPFTKHSSLQAIRYSQDLQSYRKKVLKGIKNRSRSYKVLRYQSIMKKKSLGEGLTHQMETLEEEGTGQGTGRKTPSPTDSKSGEKRRGRPRKSKSQKLNERRRSDKEVDFIEKNFETEGGEGSLNKRKRKLSSKLQYYKTSHGSEDKDEFSSGQVITTKSGDSNRKFTCAVCKDIFPDSKVFREHIVIHRMEEGTYQCMECGECFVVRPSLEKHLHAFHKIRNTDKYITDNDCWNIKKDGTDGEGEPLKENQCKVCKDQFDRAVDLTKHFRIHGMAFLKEFRKDSKTK